MPEQSAPIASRPEIVCLCGSTRFYDTFQKANFDLTMAGKIVLSVGFYPHSAEQAHGESVGITPEQKAGLDDLHKRKIDLADRVLVLNVGGYYGTSTLGEIVHARATGKPVDYLEPPRPCIEFGECEDDEGLCFACAEYNRWLVQARS